MNVLDKVKIGASLLSHSLFYAMKAGDNELSSTSNGNGDSEINHHITSDNVMGDFLDENETQKVKEIRDAYYRILNEADKYHVDIIKGFGDGEENEDIIAVSRKKTASDFSKHCNVYEDEYKLKVIQDNKHIAKETFNYNPDIWDYDTTLTLEWDGFSPRFMLNKFVTKIVVKEYDKTKSIIELYVPTIPGQFTKLDAILVNELNEIFNKKKRSSDFLDIKHLEFITDKCWNCDNLCSFKYDNLQYSDIVVYDGNFVIRFFGDIVEEGVSIAEKYRTKELDEKYEKKAPKKENVDLFAAERRIIADDFATKKLKIDEDCN